MANEKSLLQHWKLLKAAACDPNNSRTDVAVLAVILDRIGATGDCWPALTTIAHDAGVNRSSAVRSVRRLCTGEYLTRLSGGPKEGSNRYRVGVKGRGEAAPTCSGELAPTGRGEAAPKVGAERCFEVGAELHPELAFKSNLPIEPTQKHACAFDDFWRRYPRQEGEDEAKSVWQAHKLDEAVHMMLTDIAAREADPGQWVEPRYVPTPAKYLRGRRWLDNWQPHRPQLSKTAQGIVALQGVMDSGVTSPNTSRPVIRLTVETPEERHRNYINQQFDLGAYGDGPEAVAERDRRLAEFHSPQLRSATA